MLPPYANEHQTLINERSDITNLRNYLDLKGRKSIGQMQIHYAAAAAHLNAAVCYLDEEIHVLELRNQLSLIQTEYVDPNKLPF